MELVKEKFEHKLYCHTCKRRTNHGVVFEHIEGNDHPDDLQWEQSYLVTKCLGCDNIAFATEYGDETMASFDAFGDWEHYTDITVYPEEPQKENHSRHKLHLEKDFKNTPELITMLYSQIVSAFNQNSFLLSAVGLRMMLEGICKDLDIIDGYVLNESGEKVLKDGEEVRSKKLVGKINGLVEQGIIVYKQAEILHQIRELGNTIVHELDIPKRKTILLGLEVIENMIHNIYELERYKIV